MLATREALRPGISPRYSFARHVVLLHVLPLAAIAAALALLADLKPVELATVPAAFLFANLVEYVAHRGPMHHRTRPLAFLFERHTVGHHAYFRADSMRVDAPRDMRWVLFPAWAFPFLALTTAPAVLPLFLVLGRNVALLFFATAVAYYLLYEWLHASYHLFAIESLARIPFVGKAARRHRLHHDPARMNDVNFNITFPIVDRLLGTARLDEP
jgi:hypothetical protein